MCHQTSTIRMPLRSPKPSIREMKKAIIDAGLETEDLVERSHVEERYEEALALQPREVDQSSSKAKGMAQAAALQKKASEAPPNRTPARAERERLVAHGGFVQGLQERGADPSAPRAKNDGRGLQMAGQADQVDEQYSMFYDRCVAIHQSRDKALKFYEQKITRGGSRRSRPRLY